MEMIMKKAVVGFFLGALMFGLAACGTGDDESKNSTSTEPSSGVQSSDNQSSGAVGDENNSSSNETPDAAEGWSEEMTGIKTAVVEALGENYWPNMALDAQMLEGFFQIKPEMYDDYMAEMPMISNNVDTLIVVKAKEGQVDAVEAALNAYRDVQINEAHQYPMNVGKVQASVIEKIGNYVIFAQLGADTMEAMDKGDEAVVKQCQEANELAISTIRQKVE
jgi:hypothetical protein